MLDLSNTAIVSTIGKTDNTCRLFVVIIYNTFDVRLKSVKTAPGTRAGTVHAIAEKLNLTYTGIYDSSLYNETEPTEDD
jgi:acetoacetate decarboxylase